MAARPSPLLWVLFLAYFTFGMITNVLGVVIPEVIKDYQLSLFAAGILAFAFFLAYGLFSIPTGLLMDRLGPRPLVLLGVALMGLGCLVVSWARNYPLIVGMIFAVGVGVTVLQTAGNPLIQHLDRTENYHRNLTLTIGFCGIGAFLGPFILAFVRGTGRPWQTLYLFFAGLSGLLLVLLFLSRFPASEKAATERAAPSYGALLLHPIVIAYSLGIFFYVGAEVGTASWIVKFFERVHGVSGEVSNAEAASFIGRVLPTLPALVVALYWGMQGAGRLVSGAVLNRFGSRRILRIYSFMALACLLLAALAPARGLSAAGFIACGFFTSVLFTLIFSGTINSFTDSHGAISGLLCTAAVGGAIVPPIVGLVGDHSGLRVAMLIPALCFSYVFGLAMLGRAKYE